MLALTKLVRANKLESHFDMAYAILTQVLYTHVPRSAEAFIWYGKKEKI